MSLLLTHIKQDFKILITASRKDLHKVYMYIK